MSYRNEAMDGAQVQGVSPRIHQLRDLRRRTRPADQPGGGGLGDRPVTIIGWDVADKLFGPIDPIDKTISIGRCHFRVVGVHKKKGSMFGKSQDKFAIISMGNFQKMFGNAHVRPAAGGQAQISPK